MDKIWQDIFILLKSKKIRYTLILAFAAIIAFIFGKQLLKYYGAKPSKKDKRDYKIAGVSPTIYIPNEFSLKVPEIKDQGQCNSCVAHSMSYLSETIFPTKGNYDDDRFSVGFVYGYRPSNYFQGQGMFPREAMKTIQQYGNVRFKDFPFNEEIPAICNRVMNNFPALTEKAGHNKIATYFQLTTADEIKTCLMKYGPVSIMFPVHEEFMDPVQGVIDVKGLKKFQGYHQISLYGWKGDYWLMVNSWSDSWGNNGTALISMKYPWSEAWGMSLNPDASVAQKKTSLLKRIFG